MDYFIVTKLNFVCFFWASFNDMTIAGKGVRFGHRYRWRKVLRLLVVQLNLRSDSDRIGGAIASRTRNCGCVGWAGGSAVIERC